MKLTNESGMDRIIRVIGGAVILILGWSNIVHGGFGLFLRYFGFLPLITGLVGFCPAYYLLHFRTKKVE